MARKKPADAAKAKAAKQKKMVIALSSVLVLAMGYAVKTMMTLNGSSGAQPQAVAAPQPAPAPSAPTTAAPVAPSLSSGSPVAVPSTDISLPTADLVSASRPAAQTGQLQSFSLFESKDPFAANGPAAKGAGGSGSGGSGGSGSGKPPATPPVTPPAPPVPPVTSAVISVNGVSELVTAGGAFPASNPIFQLVSLTAKTAKVTVVGGSYASGAASLTLTEKKPVTLQNTADGTTYTLLLLPQGTATTPAGTSTTPTVPPAPSAPSAPPSLPGG
jgi:hypothetical protein